MEKRILKHIKERSYTLTGFTKNSYALYYLHMFLSSLSFKDLKKGAKLYDRGQSDCLMIDYCENSEDDFYVALWDLADSNDYKIEYQGRMVIDDSKIKKLKLSYDNFDYIFKQWEKISKDTPKYLILSQDNAGWISLLGKNELNQEELMLERDFSRH